MRMDVDEAGQREARAAVDHPVGRAGEVAPEKGDAVVAEGDIDATAVNLTAQRLVPGDHPGGVLDHRRRHLAHSKATSADRDCFASLAMTMKAKSATKWRHGMAEPGPR